METATEKRTSPDFTTANWEGRIPPGTALKTTTYPIITLTGGDRKGKATQARLLAARLGAHLMSFPDYTSITGQIIRACLTPSHLHVGRELWSKDLVDGGYPLVESVSLHGGYEKEPYHFQALNFMARMEHQDEIREKLRTAPIVMDRYEVDAYVYGAVDGCELDWIVGLQQPLIPSDIVLVINGPTYTRNEYADVNETDSVFAQAIHDKFLSTAAAMEWNVINTIAGPPVGDRYSQAQSNGISIARTQDAIYDTVIRKFPTLATNCYIGIKSEPKVLTPELGRVLPG